MEKEPSPSVSLNQEEESLISDGLVRLEDERKRTVVFERLLMKLKKVKDFWVTVENARRAKQANMAGDSEGKQEG